MTEREASSVVVGEDTVDTPLTTGISASINTRLSESALSRTDSVLQNDSDNENELNKPNENHKSENDSAHSVTDEHGENKTKRCKTEDDTTSYLDNVDTADAAMIGDNLDEEQLNKAKMFNEAFYRKHQFDEDEMDGFLSSSKKELQLKQEPSQSATDMYPTEYRMNHKKRGLFLLFNQMNFDPSTRMGTRLGTNEDAANLMSLFQGMGFDVKRYTDRRKKDILKILQEASSYNHSDSDCFACAFLTHGDQINNEDIVFANDAYIYNKDIFAFFKGDKCSSLAGKPKFFIFQACRGSNLDDGTDAVDGLDCADGDVKRRRIPIEADFLFAYSTTPRYYSWRNQELGSWFIQDLVKVFEQHHNTLDVLSMLTLVNGKVAFEHESNSSGKMHMKRQMPCIVSQLTKHFYLKNKTI